MEFKTDKYTKIILTIIAITLICILFKPEVTKLVTPQTASARIAADILDAEGNPLSVFDVVIQNKDGQPVPVILAKPITIDPKTAIKVKWDEPMPVYIVGEKKN